MPSGGGYSYQRWRSGVLHQFRGQGPHWWRGVAAGGDGQGPLRQYHSVDFMVK